MKAANTNIQARERSGGGTLEWAMGVWASVPVCYGPATLRSTSRDGVRAAARAPSRCSGSRRSFPPGRSACGRGRRRCHRRRSRRALWPRRRGPRWAEWLSQGLRSHSWGVLAMPGAGGSAQGVGLRSADGVRRNRATLGTRQEASSGTLSGVGRGAGGPKSYARRTVAALRAQRACGFRSDLSDRCEALASAPSLVSPLLAESRRGSLSTKHRRPPQSLRVGVLPRLAMAHRCKRCRRVRGGHQDSLP